MGKTYFGQKEQGTSPERRESRPERRREEYRYETAGERPRKKKKRRVWLLLLELLLLVILAFGAFAWSKLSKMETVKLDKEEVQANEDMPAAEQEVLDGYTNIALFGGDSREGNLESSTHSDTIIIASINNKTKEIKLVSVYRDTYLDNTNGEYRKATEAYYLGGYERSIKMLNKNLDLDISKFVTVDFNVVADVVDLIGGVEIDVQADEIEYINGYQVEGSEVTGKEIVNVTETGLQTLNGLQALSYCRIRYTSGNDMKRTERQRDVLTQIFNKAVRMDLGTLNELIDTVFPEICTNLTLVDMLGLAKDVASYSLGESTGFPFEYQTGTYGGASVVMPVNLAQNVTELHEWLFGTTDYTPSATVQEISNYLISYSGLQ